MAGVVVIIAAVAIAVGFGLYRLATDGRFRAHGQRSASVLAGTPYADRLGERATLLQFSSAFCAPCRAARRILGEVADIVPGVVHVEIDAEHHLELVRRLGVLRTPTTLVLDASGREVSRAGGAPSRDAVLQTLERSLSDG